MIPLEVLENSVKDLDAIRETKKAEYRSAQPFPHCCIDNLFSDELLEEVVKEFPDRQKDGWRVAERDGKSKGKLITKAGQELGPYTRYVFGILGSPRFLRFVEDVTGVPGLISDPYVNSGGLHSIENGGYLELHSDFYWHSHLHIYRRLNVLLYLNKDWKEEYEGALELWDRKLRKSASYSPLWNRLIIQDVTAETMHGFPKPIKCPDGMSRRSLAMWYYTARVPTNVQLGWDLCSPGFVQRNGRAVPLRRRLWRRLLPPVAAALFEKQTHVINLFSRHEVWRAVSRFLPPVVVEGYQRMRGREV